MEILCKFEVVCWSSDSKSSIELDNDCRSAASSSFNGSKEREYYLMSAIISFDAAPSRAAVRSSTPSDGRREFHRAPRRAISIAAANSFARRCCCQHNEQQQLISSVNNNNNNCCEARLPEKRRLEEGAKLARSASERADIWQIMEWNGTNRIELNRKG